MTAAFLTIAIPTYNRAGLVREAIKSLMDQNNQSDAWEILIVNNNSTDNTEKTLKQLKQDCDRLRYVNEAIAGSSQARNRAIKECRTEYILFVDDECTFRDDYVDRAIQIISKHEPKMFGGPVYARFLEGAPAWFLSEYGAFSIPEATGRSNRVFLSGANIGFKVDAIAHIGGFDPKLGMFGPAMGYGEETAVEMKMLEKYGPDAVWFDADFINYHLVRPEKYKWSFLLKEHFLRGRAQAKLSKSLTEQIVRDIPDCLKAKKSGTPTPDDTRRTYWQNIAYEKGLPVIRKIGLLWEKISHAVSINFST